MGSSDLTANFGNLLDIAKLSKPTWQTKMADAVRDMLNDPFVRGSLDVDHIALTPERFVDALQEYFAGVSIDPKKMLTKALFNPPNSKQSQMVHVCDSKFYSTCAHHLAPIVGKWHFAYIPNEKLVGISKIPRLVEIYSRRPQVQENLTEEIVEAFQEIVQPAGCGLMMKASHFCMEARGAKAHGSITVTTALRGCFLDAKVKEEFLLTASALRWSL